MKPPIQSSSIQAASLSIFREMKPDYEPSITAFETIEIDFNDLLRRDIVQSSKN